MTIRRRASLAATIALGLLIVLDGAVWLWACARLERDLDAAITTLATHGIKVTTGERTRRGWPFAAELAFAGVAVAADADAVPGGPRWTADRATLGVSLGRPRTLVGAAYGAQTLAVAGLGEVSFTAMRLDGEAALAGDAPPRLSLAELKAELPTRSPGGPDHSTLTIGAASATFPTEAVRLEAERIALPGIAPLVDGVAVALSVPGLPEAPTPMARLLAWRRQGGRLTVPAARLHWGALEATGAFTLQLDAALQPEGEGTLAVSGLAPALDMWAGAGLIPARTALAAKAVFGILAAPAKGGPVSLPVQLQAGVLSIARFPLLRLPPLGGDRP